MPTCKCGKEVADARGARGHVQFTDGDGHGDHGDVPDDWRELFSGLDGEADEDSQDDASSDGDQDEGQESDPTPESNSGQSEASESKGRIRRVLTTPLDELVGGGE